MNTVPHYNAFISYRHHPQDIAVAEAIHKGLERFKVPTSLKKQGKKIERIFRDKEELPITSSLTDTITTALRNSDFQIVICSTHLKDSYWVQREIETFLQTHTKDQILTVIVDGEPGEVIPEILTYRDVADPVTGQTVREPLEPLSCDWRLPKRKAMKQELPRLVAVLLGCTYNDLIQRQKQYQMRRLAIGAGVGMAASLALAGYFLYTGIQIQENLNQSLRNQSQYLASASESLYENGDRLTAISLALAALPSENDPRPYVVEAEKSLSDALMLYDPASDIISIGAYNADALVEDFVLTDEGERLYILDSRGDITVWDTAAFTQTAAFRLISSAEEIFTDNSGNLLTKDRYGDKQLCSYAPDGTLRWFMEEISDAAFYKDKSALLVTVRRDEGNYLLTVDPDTGKETEDPLYICDTDRASFVHLECESYYREYPLPITLYKSGYTVALFSREEGSLNRLVTTENFIHCLNLTSDGRVLLNVPHLTGALTGYMLDSTIAGPSDFTVYCFDAHGKALWQRNLTYYMSCNLYTLEAHEPTDGIFVQSGSCFTLLDSKNGEVLAQCHALSYPLVTEMREDGVWAFFSDGSMGSFSFEKQTISTIRYMEAGNVHAAVNHGIYVSRQLNTTVTRYATTADNSYTMLEGSFGDYARRMISNDSHLVISSNDFLTVFDLATRKQLWQADSKGSYWSIVGISDDGSTLYTAYAHEGLRRYDMTTGDCTLLAFPTEAEYPYASYPDAYLLSGEHIYYTLYPKVYDPACLVDWNLTTGEYTVHDCYPHDLFEKWSTYYAPMTPVYSDSEHVLVHAGTGQLFAFTPADGQFTELLPDIGTYPVLFPDTETGALFVASGHTIAALGQDNQIVHTMTLPETAAVSLTVHRDVLYALCDDGYVYCYDREGSFLKRITLSLYTNYYADVKRLKDLRSPIFWAFTPDDELVLNAASMGNLVPLEGSTYCADIPYLVCYHAGTDSFVCTYDSKNLIAYDRLTTEEVMTRAKDVLGNYQLTEDQKSYYGLN